MKLSPVLFLVGGFLFFFPTSASAKLEVEKSLYHPTNSVPWRTVKIKPGPNVPKIHFYNKLNPVWWLKNSDDPNPPTWYRPDDKHRRVKWSFRNPLHNFNFYVIGVADKKFSRSGQFPEKNSDPRGGWDFEAARYKFIYLPYISYHRENKFDFYFGWRNHGNFGIKFNVNPVRPPKTTKPDSKSGAPAEADDASED